MASMAFENNWGYNMDGDDDVKHEGSEDFQLSPRNRRLLMSLLDETQVDDCDDEQQLSEVIRSLEAEIGSQGHFYGNDIVGGEDPMDCESINGESNNCGRLVRHEEVELDRWLDVEIVGSDGMGNWGMDQNGQGMVSEFGGENNYHGIGEDDFDLLWHEDKLNNNLL